MKKPLTRTLILMFLLASCTPEETTVGIARHPVLAFTSPSMTWQADRYSFEAPSRVVAYPADTTLPGRLYNRLTLQATGENDQGDNLQLILMFDTEDASQLIGTYRPLYTTTRGLAQVQLFNLNNNELAAYALKPNDSTAVLQIRRQSQTERLIAGTFQMTLYDTRDTTQTINITNGAFTDINY
jgi:hypothetical protein